VAAQLAIGALKQAWLFKVIYLGTDDTVHRMDGTMFAARMDTVYRYLQRKFSRISKAVEDVDVFNGGMLVQGDKLELIENTDGSISAIKADGTLVAQESFSVTVISPYGVGAPCTYVPSPPKETFPALDTYSAFYKVATPPPLERLGGSSHHFRARFYDVFPREK
jgi:hypothetical protein